jgi:hypothetical protein
LVLHGLALPNLLIWVTSRFSIPAIHTLDCVAAILMPIELLQVLWFANSVVQNTVMYLRRQGAIDHRWACSQVAVACRLAISIDSGAQCICLVATGRQLPPQHHATAAMSKT